MSGDSTHGLPPASPPAFQKRLSSVRVLPGTRAYRRINGALFLSGFATFSALYGVQPLLPEFVTAYEVTPTASSLALSLTTGLLGFSILGAAAAAEVVGRKRLMFASLVTAALLNLYAAVAVQWESLLIARALAGVALGGVPAVAMAYLAEEIDPAGLGFTVGIYIGGNALGGMMGRVAVGLILHFTSWRTALALLSLADLLAAAGFFLLLPASRNFIPRPEFGIRAHVSAWVGHLRHGTLRFLFLTGLLAMGVFITVYNYLGFRLLAPPYSLPQAQAGLIYTAYLFGMVASPVAGAFADRFGKGPVLLAGTLITLMGLGLASVSFLLGVVAGVVVLTIGFFALHAVASSWAGQMARQNKGHATSLYYLSYYLGSSLAGTAGGWFWECCGWPGVAGFTAVLLVVALGVELELCRRTWQRRPEAPGGM